MSSDASYEYFLMKFAIQGAQDNGEFFTPPSLVQTIVNVIEPDHGIVFDPACGSGGMFVQSSHFIERLGQDTAHRVTFFGQEKTATTIRLAKMNLAVHGLEGDIREANTFYEDVHTLVGKCDFVMANPPFNVDMVDAEKVEGDCRLPFGLPGVNKQKMENWTQKERTQAEVKVFILDRLFETLPNPPYSVDETQATADRIYEYVWQRSTDGSLFPRHIAA
jgi:type I restriction-modification system DNA methylase subunit